MTQSKLSDHQLRSICSVEAVDAVGTSNAILHGAPNGLSVTIMEKACHFQYIFRDVLERGYDILVPTSLD